MVSAAPTAAGIAARYRKINGLQGVEVTDGDRIMLRVGAVTGLRIARPLADHVRTALEKRRQRTPTIEYSRGANLMFLVNAPVGETHWDNRLFRYVAVRMGCGAMIALPGPGSSAWLVPPEGDRRIDFDALAHITIETATTKPRRDRTRLG